MDWIELGVEMQKYGLPMLGTALACVGEPRVTALSLIANDMRKDPAFITAPLVNMWIRDPRIWPVLNLLERRVDKALYAAIVRAYMGRGGR